VSSRSSETVTVAQLAGSKADRLWCSVGILILLLAVVVILIPNIPPLQDFNDWAYQGFLVKESVLGKPIPAAFKHWPVPSAISQLIFALMTAIFTPILAARVFACAYICLSGLAMWKAAEQADQAGRGSRFLLLIVLVVVHAPFWSGEINYQVGLVILIWYVGRYRLKPAPGLLTDVGFSLLLFACHALSLGMFLIYVGWRELARLNIGRIIVTALPALILCAWFVSADPRHEYIPGDPLTVGPQLVGLSQEVAYRFYVLAKAGPYQNLVFDNFGDYDRLKSAYLIGIAINVLFSGSMALYCVAWVLNSIKKKVFSPELLTSVTFALIAVINPGLTLGIGNASERFLYPALAIAVLSFSPPLLLRRLVLGFGSCLAIFLAYQIWVLPRSKPLPDNSDSRQVNQPALRPRLIFWHRPFLFYGQLEAAESSARSGMPPTADIVWETSILQKKR
jgi:hypothetical protein